MSTDRSNRAYRQHCRTCGKSRKNCLCASFTPKVKRQWDPTDIAQLVSAAVDGFAENFYDGREFDHLSSCDKKTVLLAIATQCRELAATA